MMNWRQDKQGFTIIELLLAASLLLVLLTPVYALLHSSISAYRRAEAGINNQENLRIAMEAITGDLRAAAYLMKPPGLNRLDENNLYFIDNEGDHIWYYRSGRSLTWAIKKKGETAFAGHNPVADGITALKFTYDKTPAAESSLITIFMEGTDELGHVIQLESSVRLRRD